MAGMEIFGWALVLTTLIGLVYYPADRQELQRPIHLTVAALLIWIGIGIVWNQDHIENPWLALGETRWVFSFVAVTLALNNTFEERTAKKFLFILSGLGAIVGLYSIQQYWGGYDYLRGSRSPLLLLEETRGTEALRYRPYGLFRMTLTYAAAYAMFAMFPFCVSFYYKNRDKRLFWFLQSCCWIALISVFLTFSRGIWIGMIPVIAIMLWILQRKVLVTSALSAIIILTVSTVLSPALQARIKSFTDMKHKSNSERMTIWRGNLEEFKDHPILGVGYQQNGPPLLKEYFARMGKPDAFASHAHNVYLNFLSGTGIVGLLLYLGFVLGTFWIGTQNVKKLSKEKDWLYYFSLAGVAALAIFIIGGLTEYNFGDSEIRYQFLTHLSFQLFISRKIS
jgi:O-antigen ligase